LPTQCHCYFRGWFIARESVLLNARHPLHCEARRLRLLTGACELTFAIIPLTQQLLGDARPPNSSQKQGIVSICGKVRPVVDVAVEQSWR